MLPLGGNKVAVIHLLPGIYLDRRSQTRGSLSGGMKCSGGNEMVVKPSHVILHTIQLSQSDEVGAHERTRLTFS